MLHLSRIFAISTVVAARYTRAQYSATYLPSNVPAKTEQGQAGTNQCGTASSQNSECQNAFINSVTDFCVFSPPNPGPDSVIGNTERIEVAWCLQDGTGARLIPDGTIQGAHFIETPDFVQVTGNPIGGLVFSSAFGQLEQLHEWTNFVGADEFCFRACKPGPKAATFCQHIYDVMGCAWNMPGNYDVGFENCQADSGEPMGVYGTSTFFQGQPSTPAAHPAPASSKCVAFSTVGNGLFNSGTTVSVPPPPPSASASATSAISVSGSRSSSSSAVSVTSPLPSSSASVQQTTGASGTQPGPGIPTTGPPAATNTSSSASRFAPANGWERAVVTLGSVVVCYVLGAVFSL
ncbi:hypothetical protein GALMADRAFT_277444 [Galerina marginata CBS 339.88]|uniref:Carbohydrate-binding module family 13 protein n=1 Tax=Galerina marginata (strain CBS 339.88) TaxID=685588 RepID=A0A067TAF2_GALM3|nr:hypothetical protein GALMADRAFT_277444 [Galerina marginata CBS 339.88]